MERRSMLTAAMAASLGIGAAHAAEPNDVANSVIWKPLQKGVTPSLCVDSLKTQADTLNMKQVGYLPLSRQVELMLGTRQPLTEVFMFCNPLTAVKMVAANFAFGAYLPCRITLVERAPGRYGLVMLDLVPLIAQIPPASPLRKEADAVNTALLSIMAAGASGSL